MGSITSNRPANTTDMFSACRTLVKYVYWYNVKGEYQLYRVQKAVSQIGGKDTRIRIGQTIIGFSYNTGMTGYFYSHSDEDATRRTAKKVEEHLQVLRGEVCLP